MPETGPRAVRWLCPVRGCGEVLMACAEDGTDLLFQYQTAAARRARCPRGHSFDRAGSGYWNLLQPQDRRSANPGDRKAMALARRRLFARGMQSHLVEVLSARVRETAPMGGALLDVGCGEGSIAAAVAEGYALHGVDLSAPSIDLAARAFPSASWVVANADRGLPYATGSFDVVLSIAARRPGAEFHRVLRSSGVLLLAIPSPDDLAELRDAVLGSRPALAGSAAVVGEMAPWFLAHTVERVERRLDFDREGLEDLLLATYRGQRSSQIHKRSGLEGLRVTASQEILMLRPRATRSISG